VKEDDSSSEIGFGEDVHRVFPNSIQIFWIQNFLVKNPNFNYRNPVMSLSLRFNSVDLFVIFCALLSIIKHTISILI